MPQPLQTFQTKVGFAKEATWGTPVNPAAQAEMWPPVFNPKLEDIIESIYDDNYRSRASQHQGYQQGFRQSKYSFESQWFPEPCGLWLFGIMGTDGYSAGSTHPFTIKNTALPDSYTIQDFYGITGSNTRQLTGMYFDTVTMSGTDKGPLKATVSLMGGKASTLVAQPTAAYTAKQPFLTWQGALTLNSISNLKIISYDLTLKRNVLPILAMGAQDPSAAGSYQFTASGKMVFETNDDTEYLLYNTTGQAAFPVVMTFTSGANSLAITSTKTQFESPTTFDRGSPFVKTSVSFQCIDNATDGGALAITLVGGKGSTYNTSP